MKDPTSPATSKASGVAWPPIAIPGQGLPRNREERTEPRPETGGATSDAPNRSTPGLPDSAGDPAPGGSETQDGAGAAGEGSALLDDLRTAIGRYVVLPSDEALTAVTLWVAASHIQPGLQHAPRLAVVGPTKGCGKSRLLDVLYETVHQPMMTVNTSPAVVFRVIGKNPPTLLVDEGRA